MVVMGRLVGVHGVRGWLKVESYTQPRANIFRYSPWYLEDADSWRETAVSDGRPQGKGLVVKLEGIDDRDAAAAMIGTDVAVRREQLPALDGEDYYWSDLIGLSVVTTRGENLGVVHNLMETGANDVLIVRGDRERLVPYVRGRVVTAIDLDAGRIEVDWDADF